MSLLQKLKDTVSQPTNRPVNTSITPDDAYKAVSNERRRRVLGFLSEHDVGETVSVSDLADRLSNGENRTACYVALIQSHMIVLSTKDGIGAVDYDTQAKTVTVRPEVFVLHQAAKAFETELN
ncbi:MULTISPECIES: DUF7344 domain-containing protein [Haloarcula]|uniref:DUF7344 domain-containing protein n=1 Tax=Haloarcula TaxID=2237 RepID=UPI0023EAE50B|nr:hypothetical protein [Halomicroarcula sp. XH51]